MMVMITKKKIFLASGAELVEERDAVELVIQRKNSELIAKDLFFEVVRWEQLIQYFGKTRAQDHYSEEISKCDIVIVLFYKRVGKYTKEEFDKAYDLFKSGKNPRYLYVYFKKWMVASDNIDDDILGVSKIRNEISTKEQIFIDFENKYELQNSVTHQIDLLTNIFENEVGVVPVEIKEIEKEACALPELNNDTHIIKHRKDVKKIAERCDMFTRWKVNGHLKFQDGDISYFSGKFSAFELELQFRSRRLILAKADEIGIRIDEPGDLSQKAKRIEAMLFDIWSKSCKAG